MLKILFRSTYWLAALSVFVLQSCSAQNASRPSKVKPATSTGNILPAGTSAGKQFAAWLDALNSGRRETLQQFIAGNFEPPPNVSLPVEKITNRHFECL